jgi:hypothetical protein
VPVLRHVHGVVDLRQFERRGFVLAEKYVALYTLGSCSLVRYHTGTGRISRAGRIIENK